MSTAPEQEYVAKSPPSSSKSMAILFRSLYALDALVKADLDGAYFGGSKIMTSNFSEDEVVLDGPVVPINATSFSNQNYTEEEQVVVGSLLTSVVILGSFTSGSI